MKVVYCNQDCQKSHWSLAGGNHEAHCIPTPQLEAMYTCGYEACGKTGVAAVFMQCGR